MSADGKPAAAGDETWRGAARRPRERHASGDVAVDAWRRDRRLAGARLRAAREAAALSQLALSAASGVTNDTICRLERGTRAPQAKTLRRLAAALGVEPDTLVAPPVGD